MTTDIFSALEASPVISDLSQMKSFIEAADFSDWSVFNNAKRSFLENFKLYQSQDKQKIWKEFTEVADSARGIKKHQEEEGDFAAEMIAKALDAHEIELQNKPSSVLSHPLFEKVDAFKTVKQELKQALSLIKFLSLKGSQLQALRQELTKTGMRLSVKGKLFDRLSKLGDAVFPVKKECNRQLIEAFHIGLEAFIKGCQKREDGEEILFEIRIIQSFLKEMTLRKQEYDLIKTSLDPLWKKAVILKDKNELVLKELHLKSMELKKTFQVEFDSLKALVEAGKDQEAIKLYESLILKLKDRNIQKNDYKSLKYDLEHFSKPVFDRLKEQKDLKVEIMKQQATQAEELKNKYFEVLCSTESSQEEKKEAFEQSLALNLNMDELYRFKLKYIASSIGVANDEDRLQELYIETKKVQEAIRGLLATSGFDFAMSMGLQESYNDCKHLLAELLKRF